MQPSQKSLKKKKILSRDLWALIWVTTPVWSNYCDCGMRLLRFGLAFSKARGCMKVDPQINGNYQNKRNAATMFTLLGSVTGKLWNGQDEALYQRPQQTFPMSLWIQKHNKEYVLHCSPVYHCVCVSIIYQSKYL